MKTIDVLSSKLKIVTAALFIAILLAFQLPLGPDADLDFPRDLKPDIPGDINRERLKQYDDNKQFAYSQRLFDILSWRTFVAVNWPTLSLSQPKPLPNLSDPGIPVWAHYKESAEIFKADGSKPSAWGDHSALAAIPGMPDVQPYANQPFRVLTHTSKHDAAEDRFEGNQAFSGGLWDRYGELVYYEILVNQPEFTYIVDSTLYNLEGQIAFSKRHQQVNFPAGKYESREVGAVEIKIAWRVLNPDLDIPGRYLTMDGYIPAANFVDNVSCQVTRDTTKGYRKVRLGMVGMHISHKTASSPQWVWSTFEHVDNLTADPMISGKNSKGGDVKSLQSSFFDPTCITCLPNTCPAADDSGVRKSQLIRMLPISGDKMSLNAAAAKRLNELNSVLQYYQLIDTQWPTQPRVAPTPAGQVAQSVQNKAGGNVVPYFLTNMTMESTFQQGVQPAYQLEESYDARYTRKDIDTNIYGTESCVGCHYSASMATGTKVQKKTGKVVPIFGAPGQADFSWLLEKARFKSK